MSKYADFFITSRRMRGKKPIALVNSSHLRTFIDVLLEDDDIETEIKVAIILCISGGLRVSEMLSIKKKDIQRDGEYMFIKTNVLKKRRKETRWIRIYPTAQTFIETFIENKIGETIVNYSQSGLYRALQRIFGIEGLCNHSFRHSLISELLFGQHLTIIECAKLVSVSIGIIEIYCHLDARAKLKEIWKNQ